MKFNLKYPCRPFIVYQKFGEDAACYRPLDKSVVGKVNGTCPIGYVSLYAYSGMKGHNGTDLYGASGTPVFYAGPDGFVEEIESEASRGLGIGIITDYKYEIEGGLFQVKTRYWHLKNFNIVYDQKVKTGDLIGWADNTGYSSGDHLHFECKPVIKNSVGKYYNAFQDNGFYGAIDAEHYFDGTYAEKTNKFLVNLEVGDESDEVKRLQQVLQQMGYFTYPDCTGFYGRETAKAVLAFQWANKLISVWSYFYYRGQYFYEKTRAKLNSMI